MLVTTSESQIDIASRAAEKVDFLICDLLACTYEHGKSTFAHKQRESVLTELGNDARFFPCGAGGRYSGVGELI